MLKMGTYNKGTSEFNPKALSSYYGKAEKKTLYPTLNILRVAKSELTSGNTSGRCYVQPSAGAAFFLTDRHDAVNDIGREIRDRTAKTKT